MPGQPIDFYGDNFERTIIFVHGRGGSGKSTLANIFKDNHNTIVIHADRYCYEYFKPASFETGFSLAKVNREHHPALAKYISSQIGSIPDIRYYKLYIIESWFFGLEEGRYQTLLVKKLRLFPNRVWQLRQGELL